MSIKTINKKCHTNVDCENGLGYATFRVAMGDEIADNWQRFGKWVLTHREATGMRQEDLASLIGSDRQTIYRIEKGNSTKRQTIAKIAEALSQPVETALAIAFGVEVNDNPIESALLDALKRLPKEKQQDVLTMVRALAANQRPDPVALIPLEFENPVIPDGSDAPDYADELAELYGAEIRKNEAERRTLQAELDRMRRSAASKLAACDDLVTLAKQVQAFARIPPLEDRRSVLVAFGVRIEADGRQWEFRIGAG